MSLVPGQCCVGCLRFLKFTRSFNSLCCSIVIIIKKLRYTQKLRRNMTAYGSGKLRWQSTDRSYSGIPLWAPSEDACCNHIL